MRSQAADRVLVEVRLRLRAWRIADAVRTAAWLTFVIAAIAVTLHAFVRPVGHLEIVVALGVVWSVLAACAWLQAIDRRECAAWADRHLEGACAFETYLEHCDGPALTPEVERQFGGSLERVASAAGDRLRAMPVETNVGRPLALATVGLLLTVVLLQVPVQMRAGARHGAITGTTAASAGNSGSVALSGARREDAATSAPERAQAAAQPASNTGTRGGVTADGRPAHLDEATGGRTPGDTTNGAVAKQPGSGGRDAGDTADADANPALSEAWQGAMAARFRELAAPPEAAARADPTLAATYSPEDTSRATPSEVLTQQLAAASPPPARHTSSPDPAERAYIRAYLSLQGAPP